LRRAILKNVQDPLAEKLLDKAVSPGTSLRLKVVEGELLLEATATS
jgi:ATP-dependent Clp protease ATP-binding subunit ClpA